MSRWDEFLMNFVCSSYHTKFFPWDGFHLYMGKITPAFQGFKGMKEGGFFLHLRNALKR
jgi:hypothetical protein